jgi:hypothetical protein
LNGLGYIGRIPWLEGKLYPHDSVAAHGHAGDTSAGHEVRPIGPALQTSQNGLDS